MTARGLVLTLAASVLACLHTASAQSSAAPGAVTGDAPPVAGQPPPGVAPVQGGRPYDPVLGERAAAAIGSARDALAIAIASGEPGHPDQPSWQQAYEAAETAITTAGAAGDPALLREAHLVAARGYGLMGWHARAFASYDAFFSEGGELQDEPFSAGLPSDSVLFTRSANQLAYARYLAGDHEVATGYYLTVLEVSPDDPEALRWLARIAFERNDEEGARVAIGLWERLLSVVPGDASATYYLERSRQRMERGVAASDSFYSGLQAYEAGDLEAALQGFQTALTANESFVEADTWAGRTALELGLPDLAALHWRRVVAARPDDQGAAYFLSVAELQARWGVAAGGRYVAGLANYEAGDIGAAARDFAAAAEANPAFVDAWVWAARATQEAGDVLGAVPLWERVVELSPDDDRARWFLRRARMAEQYGSVAGPAFLDALAAYEAGAVEEAARLLEEAVAAAPNFAEAWGYLGRIAFLQERFADAAEAYGRAAELAPDLEEYAFFAEEAVRLSGGDAAEEAEEGPVPEQEPEPDPQERPDTEPETEPDEDTEQRDGGETQPLPPGG